MRLKSIICAAIITAAAIFPCRITSLAEDESDFTYTIINGEATIIGFTGEPAYLEIPEAIEDCPVTKLRDNAFFNCTSLKQISLPSSITEIGHHAFYSCTALESIVLPDDLQEIGMGAFSGCKNLSAVNIPDSLKALPESCFRSCSSLKEVVIPNGITEIGDFCFSECESLSYVSIGNSVEEIGIGAFYICDSLESLYIPPSVTNINYEAVGFENGSSDSSVRYDFVIFGETDSAAEKYAEANGITFSQASEAVQSPFLSSLDIHKVPLWVILLLSGGGIGFFALSCVIAVKQHHRESERSRSEAIQGKTE
ncbi:MAG: leucine-rich repeat domain-containing protein [Ruminococcus sp.]|nr:leucine-rich repeat domain-containing protein [Ruminococcus sp.]